MTFIRFCQWLPFTIALDPLLYLLCMSSIYHLSLYIKVIFTQCLPNPFNNCPINVPSNGPTLAYFTVNNKCIFICPFSNNVCIVTKNSTLVVQY